MERNKNYVDLRGEFVAAYKEQPSPSLMSFHVHDAYELLFVLSEGVMLSVNDEEYAVPKGALLIFNNMDVHRVQSMGSDPYKRFVLWFRREYLDELGGLSEKLLRCFYVRGFSGANMLLIPEERQKGMIDRFAALAEVYGNTALRSSAIAKLRLGELLATVSELYFSRSAVEGEFDMPEQTSVYSALRYIQENCTKGITRNDLEKLTGINKRALCTQFRRLTGASTGQYILNCRIALAKAYLVQGFSVAEVCDMTGFENWSNFSRTFRNHVGESPKQYAMRMRGQ